MGMKTNERQDDCGIFSYEGRDFRRLWGGLMYGVLVIAVEQTMRAMLC